MSNHRRQLEEAIRAIRLHPPINYSWFGKRSAQLAPRVTRLLTPETARNYLLFNLQLQLYNDFYCRGFASPSYQAAIGLPPVGKTPFVEALSAANSGIGYAEDGWKVSAIKEGEVIVQRRGLELWVRPKDCLIPEGTSIAEGLRLSLRFPKELLGISPGYYLARGDADRTENGSQEMVR